MNEPARSDGVLSDRTSWLVKTYFDRSEYFDRLKYVLDLDLDLDSWSPAGGDPLDSTTCHQQVSPAVLDRLLDR
jgi:hypothetical protein